MKRFFTLLMLCATLAVACNNDGGQTDNTTSQDVTLAASYADGEYCGKFYETPDYNYYLILSDKGFTNSGEFLPNARYYYIDLYSSTPSERGGTHRVPTGAYSLDVDNTFGHGSISVLYSHLYETDSSAEYDFDDEQEFCEATLLVYGDGTMKFEAATLDGRRHTITFAGDYNLTAIPGSGADGPYTTLTQDTTLNFSNAVGMADYYGDYFGKGYAHWVFMLAPKSGTGDALQVTMMSHGMGIDESLEGTYTCSAGGEQGTFYPGVYDYGDLMDTWYCYMQNRQMPNNGPWAPIMDGTISIEKCDDGQYAVELDCLDDALTQNRITGSWRGEVSIENRARASVQSRMPHTPRAAARHMSKPRP